VLQPLEKIYSSGDYPSLLVGIDPPDDAAVWEIDKNRSIVVTTDFFTPVVDDAYDYGSIAAANSLSDIYAMGAKPFLALNIAAFPPQVPHEILSEIIRGGAEKAKEAGVVIAGGHTVQDQEPKYGLIVIGFADSDKLLLKSKVKPGDKLILTKPLGVGVTTTAIKQEKANSDDIKEAIKWMKTLNKIASEIAVSVGCRAATDITGFSLLGHAFEMAQASKVRLMIDLNSVPFLTNARLYGNKGYFAGGASDNRMFYSPNVHFSDKISEVSEMLLFDPQTSGGLLIACPPNELEKFENEALRLNQPYWVVGHAEQGSDIFVN
jgi:selenide,water dikinase